MDNRMTLRMFQAVFGGLSPASQAFISAVIAVLDSGGVVRLTAGELGELMYPDESRAAVIQRINRYKRILRVELESQGLEGIFQVIGLPASSQGFAATEYRFDLARFIEMSEQAAAVAA